MDNNKKGAFLKALGANHGNISVACKASNVGRSTIYDWKKKDAEFEQSMSDIKEGLIDLAESKLLEKIRAGHLTAVIFFLKTQGKARGYIESQHIETTSDHFEDYKLKINKLFIDNGWKPMLGDSGKIHSASQKEADQFERILPLYEAYFKKP